MQLRRSCGDQASLKRLRHHQGIVLVLSVAQEGAGRGTARGTLKMTGLVLVCFGQDSGLLTFKEDRMGSSLGSPRCWAIRRLFLSNPLGCACLLLSRAFSSDMQPRVGARSGWQSSLLYCEAVS